MIFFNRYFESVRASDPYRMDFMEYYSTTLWHRQVSLLRCNSAWTGTQAAQLLVYAINWSEGLVLKSSYKNYKNVVLC